MCSEVHVTDCGGNDMVGEDVTPPMQDQKLNLV